MIDIHHRCAGRTAYFRPKLNFDTLMYGNVDSRVTMPEPDNPVVLAEVKQRAKAMTRQPRVAYLRKRRWYRVPQGGSELWRGRNRTSRSLAVAC
jgi:hypothetical protein